MTLADHIQQLAKLVQEDPYTSNMEIGVEDRKGNLCEPLVKYCGVSNTVEIIPGMVVREYVNEA